MRKAIFAFAVVGFVFFFSSQAYAADLSQFNPGRIIDDGVMTNASTMSVQQIQDFLNSKVTSCDTAGTTMTTYNYDGATGMYGSRFTGTTVTTSRAVQGQRYDTFWRTHPDLKTQYNPNWREGDAATPFTCLKDYRVSDNRTAAQVIYDTSQKWQINPQVFIVLLQKENGLITDDYPWPLQMRTATGYGCPDNAVCDSQYFGLLNQLDWAGKLFRRVIDRDPNWYSPYVVGDNNIQWSPNASCGASTVNIQNWSTASLYDYTPYRPNTAALTAGYGTGDGCSAYGNRNFFLYFNDWFGSTTDNRLYHRIIRGDSSAEVYLQTAAGKYYVPSYTLLAEWGFGPSDVVIVPQSYANTLPTKSNLSNTLTDGVGNLFVVENGNAHQVISPSVTELWNVDSAHMVDSLGLAYTLHRKEPLGRFISQAGGDGSVWLIDKTKRHKVDGPMLYSWGYYPGITNTVSTDLFNRYSIADPVNQYASIDGGNTVWAIEASTKHPFKDVLTRNAYVGSSTPTNVSSTALSFIMNSPALTRFVYNSAQGHWFMIDDGKKYYIPRGELATLWGKPVTEGLSALTPSFLTNLPSNGNLSYTAQSSNSSSYWLIAKKRYYISDSNTNIALTGSDTAPPVYSNELIESLPQGTTMTTSLRGESSPYNYSYVLDKGSRRYPASSPSQSAWIANPTTVPNELMSLIPEGSFIGTTVRSSGGQGFYIEQAKKYLIDQSYADSWGISQATPQVDVSTLARLSEGVPLADTFTVNGTSYIMSNGSRLKLTKYKDTYPSSITTSTVISSVGDTNDGGNASYLIRSSDTSDQRVWLINKGQKILLPLFEQRVALGFLSNGIPIIPVTPSTVSAIPTSPSVYSNLIQKGSSGIKFVNFGHSLGFPDGQTLTAYINSTTGILNVADSIYDTFTINGNTSRVVYDDYGRYFWVENGQKRYINSWSAYSSAGYPNIRAVYLQGITMNLLPTGSTIQ